MGSDFLNLDIPFSNHVDSRTCRALQSMVATGTNSPETSSVGRLFDAVSSLIGLKHEVNYEGQAAIELEAIASRHCDETYEFLFDGTGNVIKAETVIRGAVEDLLNGLSPSQVSAKFHLGVARLITETARRMRDERGLNRVVLSGGVFQNMLLLSDTCRLLEKDNFEVFTHRRVPPNDEGICLGQAAIANARLAAGRI